MERRDEMKRYTITLSNDNYKRLYQTFVDAENEQEACVKAVQEAEEKGIYIPDEPWVRTKEHKQQSNEKPEYGKYEFD